MLHDLLENTIYEVHASQEKDNLWHGSKFEKIDKLKNDHSGKAGERFIANLCKTFSIPHFYDEDINSLDGTYDITIMGKKVEIKTARLGKQGCWQHENLKNQGCDYYLLLDITPEKFYITVLDGIKTDLTKKIEYLNKKAHLRDATTGVFKLDFSKNTMKLAQECGVAICVDQKTPEEHVKFFLQSKIC